MSHPKVAKTDHDVLDVIKARWSPRAFDITRPVSREAQLQLFEAARWAPSSANEQPWQFIVGDRFTNPDAFASMLATLDESNQSWAQYAPVLMLVTARAEGERFKGPNQFAKYDTGQAVTLLSVQATAMGIGVRQVAGFDSHRAGNACHVDAPFEPVVMIAFGYPGEPHVLPNAKHRAAETQPRARRPVSEFVRWMSVIALAVVTMGSAQRVTAAVPAAVPTYGYKVVNTFPHDKTAFTQGLIYRDGVLYESTGLNGSSTLRKVELTTGKVLQQSKVDAKYFAEGLTDWNGSLLQLTWRDGLGFVYDRATFAFTQTFRYYGEGWGLTHDDKRLILSDGQPAGALRFLDPTTFVETGRVIVKDQGVPVAELNELEYVKGEVFANIWQTDRIARINPTTGEVTGWIDLSGLLKPSDRTPDTDVLNGIAYDAATNRLFVTGKKWPKLFEITLVPKSRPTSAALF
ncbi:MAG: glutaminyl-peptide cyclotransferase [Acidobacteriota bacterium]